MRLELPGCVHRKACSHRLSRRVAGKEFLKFSRKSHDKGCNEARDTQERRCRRAKTMHARPKPLLLHLYPDQTSRAVARL